MIQDKAMLVRLHVSQWGGRKCDHKATDEILTAHKAKGNSGRFNKVLVDLNCIKAYQRASNDARTFHYANTLPWGDDGARILPSENFISYTSKMRELQESFQKAVDEFMTLYPDLIIRAHEDLGSLFDPRDYPTTREVKSSFNFSTEVSPIPASGDFRVNLGDDEVQKIQDEITQRVNTAIETAVKDLWARLHKSISHLVEKLKDKDAIFRDSLIGNIKDLCELLPRLNVTKDQDLENVIQKAREDLASLDPDMLRDQGAPRTDAREKAEEILKRMAGYMGV